MATVEELVEGLEWAGGTGYLPAARFEDAPMSVRHLLKRAALGCGVKAIYALRPPGQSQGMSPVVLAAEAAHALEAAQIHRQVWNQGVAPFLVMALPGEVRIYAAHHPPAAGGTPGGELLEMASTVQETVKRINWLHAAQIDSGQIWSHDLHLQSRVDRSLLSNLAALGDQLISHGLGRPGAHALIGRFVYLRYLWDRGFLTPKGLERWDLPGDMLLRRDIDATRLSKLLSGVDRWINGSIFPLPCEGVDAPQDRHVQIAAEAFYGDDLSTGQRHLPFKAYDFSYIPIEMLSVIYEQFLHREGRGTDKGAFYTPLPVIDLVLDQLQEECPWSDGGRLLDPACGSGAFLVQGYRRLIATTHQQHGRELSPWELRALLEAHIYGVDSDPDAVQIAALSLSLTLLDTLTPGSLPEDGTFKLPSLVGTNLLHGDFFDPAMRERLLTFKNGFKWIVGNPPWNSSEADSPYLYTWLRSTSNRRSRPVVAHQPAEAFAWEASDLLGIDGICGLVVPASTLFNDKQPFRKAFFRKNHLHGVINLANLRRTLFHGSEKAAAILFFSANNFTTESVLTWSPLLARQPYLRARGGRRPDVWALHVNASEVRAVSAQDVASGSALPWKVAMWGGTRDRAMLERLRRRWPSLGTSEGAGRWILSEGVQLREVPADATERQRDPHEARPDLVGIAELQTTVLRGAGPMHTLPRAALVRLPTSRSWLRIRGGRGGLAVCRGPHIVVSGARTFVVFADDDVLIPRPHHGIAAGTTTRAHLIALTLLLNSEFATYHQFFASPELGAREGRATLAALRQLPDIISGLSPEELQPWVDLHSELVRLSASDSQQTAILSLVQGTTQQQELRERERQLNELVYQRLQVSTFERWLVEDLVRVRRRCADGKVPKDVVAPPSIDEIEAYACALAGSLDEFLGEERAESHDVRVVISRGIGLVKVTLCPGSKAQVMVLRAGDAQARAMYAMHDTLQREHGQWLHFDRDLFIHQEDATWIAKPLERLSWLRSQALMDGDTLVATALGRQEGEGDVRP